MPQGNDTCLPSDLYRNVELLKKELEKVTTEIKKLEKNPCFKKNVETFNAQANLRAARSGIQLQGINNTKTDERTGKLIFTKAECSQRNCVCKKCTYRRCEACDYRNNEEMKLKQKEIKNKQDKEGKGMCSKCSGIPMSARIRPDKETKKIEEKKVQSTILSVPTKEEGKKKIGDSNKTWGEILIKSDDAKHCRCRCPDCKKESSRSQRKDNNVESIKIAKRTKNVSEKEEIQRLKDKLKRKEERAAVLSVSYASIQKELRAAQEEKEKAKLEALLRSLAEEKLKILLDEKSLIHIRQEKRMTEAFEQTLKLLIEERRKASCEEIERRMEKLKALQKDNLTSSSNDTNNSRRILNSTPSDSKLLEMGDEALWDDLSSVRRS